MFSCDGGRIKKWIILYERGRGKMPTEKLRDDE